MMKKILVFAALIGLMLSSCITPADKKLLQVYDDFNTAESIKPGESRMIPFSENIMIGSDTCIYIINRENGKILNTIPYNHKNDTLK